jgi:probable O-glycosylation ligase (exosortase A-associated)
MRDLLVVMIVCASIPFIIMRPWIGVLVWSWLGYMNPHRLAWGFAYNYPFAQTIALVTLASLLIALVSSKEKLRVQNSLALWLWIGFAVWMNVTTVFALAPDEAVMAWDRAMKIQLISFITVLVMHGRERLYALVGVIVLSLGFFGVKGGIFAALTGGSYIVWGPPGSFIEGNNELGLALVMIVPLMWWLRMRVQKPILRWAMLGAIGASSLAILSTQSRGAFLAISAMAAFLWWKSPKKLWTGLALVIAAVLLLAMMPTSWEERMRTIQTYEQDASAMGRINAWTFAYNLASARPLIGGGFNTFTPELFERYAPDPEDFHDAHSIYFQVLGEHGFVGLGLFLALLLSAFSTGNRIIRRTRGHPDLEWARDLAAMVQVGLIGYMVGGAFLGLAYFDLFYHLVAILLILRYDVEVALAGAGAGARAPVGRSLTAALDAPRSGGRT